MLTPQLNKTVYAIIQAFCATHKITLGSTGLIAGGFVSNVIYSLVHKTALSVNDLDVYFLDGRKVSASSGLQVVNPAARPLNYHEHIAYAIVDETKLHNEKLNLISIRLRNGKVRHNPSNPQQVQEYLTACHTLLGSFDLNCAQAAYDLTTHQIIASPSFLRFLNTKTIEADHLSRAPYTFLRALTKMRDLPGATTDLQLLYKACSAPFVASIQSLCLSTTCTAPHAFDSLLDRRSKDVTSIKGLKRDIHLSALCGLPLLTPTQSAILQKDCAFSGVQYSLIQSYLVRHAASMFEFSRFFRLHKLGANRYFAMPCHPSISPVELDAPFETWQKYVQDLYNSARLALQAEEFL